MWDSKPEEKSSNAIGTIAFIWWVCDAALNVVNFHPSANPRSRAASSDQKHTPISHRFASHWHHR